MSPRRAAFVLAYLEDPKRNVAEASRKAGYASPQHQLLKDPAVAEAIRRQLDRMTERYEVTVDGIVQELAKIGFANIGNYLAKDAEGNVTPSLDISNCTPDQLAALESIQYEEVVIAKTVGGEEQAPVTAKQRKVKFKLHDKKGALVDLLRQFGGQFNKEQANTGEPQKVVIEGGLPTGSIPPPDIAAAAAARKAKKPV
ncbi:MAG: terminase small subunit [Patescibacteria group bacterium]|nr:terminase small subunit [Patescibacteria group bacterium]